MKYLIKIGIALLTFFFGLSVFAFWNFYFETLPKIEVANKLSVESATPIKVNFCNLSNYSDEYESELVEIDGVLGTGDRTRIGNLYPIGCDLPQDNFLEYKKLRDTYVNLIQVDLQNYKFLLKALTEETKNGGYHYNEVNIKVTGKLTSEITDSNIKVYKIVPAKIEKTSSMRDSVAYGGG